jgi:hypothetical protein
MHFRLLRALSWCVLLGRAAPLSAQPLALELDWQAPVACADEAAIRARVGQLLVQSSANPGALRVRGRVERRVSHFRLVLRLDVHGRHAERELRSADCRSLSETAAWLVAVAVDPGLHPPLLAAGDEAANGAAAKQAPAALSGAQAQPTVAAQASPDASSSAPQAAKASADASSTAPQAAQTSPDASPAAASAASVAASSAQASHPSQPAHAPAGALPLGWGGGVYTGLWAAGLFGPAVSLGLRGGVRLAWATLELTAAEHFERSQALAGVPGVSSNASSQELGLAACALWGARVRMGPCGVLTGVSSQVRVEGVASGTHPRTALWASGGLGLALGYSIYGSLELRLDAGLWAPISARPRFNLAPVGAVGEIAPLGGSVRVGAGFILP